MSSVPDEEIILFLEKIQGIAFLMTAQPEKEIGIIGSIISDISFPLIEKIKKNNESNQ